MEFLSLFDSANPVECYRRSESIAPQQALAMANSTLTLAQARILAKKLSESLAGASAESRRRRFVESAFVRILCRPPTDDELTACLLIPGRTICRSCRTGIAYRVFLRPGRDRRSVDRSGATCPRESGSRPVNHNDFVTVR